jgi:hypothetical protein
VPSSLPHFTGLYFIPNITGNKNTTINVHAKYTGRYFEIVRPTVLVSEFLKLILKRSIAIRIKLIKIRMLEPIIASRFGVRP